MRRNVLSWVIGLSLLGISWIFYLNVSRINRDFEVSDQASQSSGVQQKMIVRQTGDWKKKQNKYASGGSFEHVSFACDRGGEEKKGSREVIMRNGILLLEPNAPATILICHGFMSCKEDMGILRHIFKGYNVMTFDFRAHGEDAGGQCCTLGCEEKHDVVGAARFLRSHPALKGKPVVVYGFSMGAVASIMAQREHPELFDCAIWDCPFDSTDDLVGRSVDRMRFSVFGYSFSLPGRSFLKKYAYHPYVQELLKAALKSIASMDATKVSTVVKPISTKEAAKSIRIPALFIACHNDDKAPPSAVLDVYKNASSSFKRCWISSGRRHFDALFVNPEKYLYKINKFIRLYLSGDYKGRTAYKVAEDPQIYEVFLTWG